MQNLCLTVGEFALNVYAAKQTSNSLDFEFRSMIIATHAIISREEGKFAFRTFV